MGNQWIERAKAEGTPLIDGDQVTFVCEGKNQPVLAGDFTDWLDKTIQMDSAGEDIWIKTLTFPLNAYLEYEFFVSDERMEDPYNSRKADNGMGSFNNYFYMPEASQTPLAEAVQGIPHGEVISADLPTNHMVLGDTRKVFFYKPPVDQPVPLLVVWDGPDYMNRASLTQIIDRLISQKRIEPIALAMIENGGPAARSIEYSCGELTIGFLMEVVLPSARKHLNLLPPSEVKGGYGVMGASMGGLMALYTGLRAPKTFQRVISQSGAFSIQKFEYIVWDLIRYKPKLDTRIWMDAGQFEWLLETNRKMHDLLKKQGYSVEYQEFAAGHNYTAWQNDLWKGLESLFGRKTAGENLSQAG